jgi:hypothetical protein
MKIRIPVQKEDKITVYSADFSGIENGIKSAVKRIDKIADSTGKFLGGIFKKEEFIKKEQ